MKSMTSMTHVHVHIAFKGYFVRDHFQMTSEFKSDIKIRAPRSQLPGEVPVLGPRPRLPQVQGRELARGPNRPSSELLRAPVAPDDARDIFYNTINVSG